MYWGGFAACNAPAGEAMLKAMLKANPPDWPLQHCWNCGRFGTRNAISRTYDCKRCDIRWNVPQEGGIGSTCCEGMLLPERQWCEEHAQWECELHRCVPKSGSALG